MALSRLSKKCQECPFVEKCESKQMEALGYLPEPQIIASAGELASQPLVQPILRETIEIHIYGEPVVVYKDQIVKELHKHLYEGLGLHLEG